MEDTKFEDTNFAKITMYSYRDAWLFFYASEAKHLPRRVPNGPRDRLAC